MNSDPWRCWTASLLTSADLSQLVARLRSREQRQERATRREAIILLRENMASTDQVTCTMRRSPKQHLVSATLLKGWTVDGVLSIVDLHDPNGPRILSRGPRGVAFERDLTSRIRVKEIEESWSRIERRAGKALGVMRDGDGLGDTRAVEAIKELIALHLTRSYEMKNIWSRLIDDDDLRIDRFVANPELLGETLLARMEVLQDSSNGELTERDAVRVTVDEHLHEVFSEALSSNLERARRFVFTAGLEICRVAVGDELIISDSPVVAMSTDGESIGLDSGMTLTEAGTVFMPLGPTTLAALGPTDTAYVLPDVLVQRFNIMQCRRAQRYVVCRPGSGLEDKIVREIRRWGTKRYVSGVWWR